jgi:hypothetical protein
MDSRSPTLSYHAVGFGKEARWMRGSQRALRSKRQFHSDVHI